MKNKIIAIFIAILFLSTIFSICWAVEQFLLVRVVLTIVLLSFLIIMVYKLSKLILDDYSKKHRKRL